MVVETGRGIPVKDNSPGLAIQKAAALESAIAVPSKEGAAAFNHATSDSRALVTQHPISKGDDMLAVVKAPPEVANTMSLAVVPSTAAEQAVATSTSLAIMPPAVNDKDVESNPLLDGIHKVWGSRETTAQYGPKFAARAKIFGGPPASMRANAQATASAPAPVEIEAGELWARRTALLMLVPDIKSIPSRDYLLAAGLMQSHLARVGIPLCVVLPVSRHARALSLANDFALRVDRNVEVYMDSSRDRAFYRDLGVYRRTHAARRTAAQRWEAWGYFLMRGCCGPAEEPCCCVGGYGFSDNSSYLGGVFLLGPGDQVHYCAMDEGAGGMKVDHESILATCTKRAEANSVRQEQAGSTLVPM